MVTDILLKHEKPFLVADDTKQWIVWFWSIDHINDRTSGKCYADSLNRCFVERQRGRANAESFPGELGDVAMT